MEFDGSLGLSEPGPREQSKAEVNGGGVQAEQFALEAELPFLAGALCLATSQNVIEEPLKQFAGSVSVGVGQGAFRWGLRHPKVIQLAACGSQTVTNLAKTLGLRELTEQHSDKMVPGIEALCATLSARTRHQVLKDDTWNKFYDLGEEIATVCHGGGSPDVV